MEVAPDFRFPYEGGQLGWGVEAWTTDYRRRNDCTTNRQGTPHLRNTYQTHKHIYQPYLNAHNFSILPLQKRGEVFKTGAWAWPRSPGCLCRRAWRGTWTTRWAPWSGAPGQSARRRRGFGFGLATASVSDVRSEGFWNIALRMTDPEWFNVARFLSGNEPKASGCIPSGCKTGDGFLVKGPLLERRRVPCQGGW